MSKTIKRVHHRTPRKSPARHPFSCLRDLLSQRAASASDSCAILAPGRQPMTYGALWTQANDVVSGLRQVGVGPTDRVAVVLPEGPDAAVAMLTVAAGAVCVPLNPGFTHDEYQRYFAELRVAALLTQFDSGSACERVARMLGIPVIAISSRSDGVAGAFSIGARARQPVADEEFASGADDALILLTSGSTSWPKTVPLTHASICLSADNVGASLALEPRDRLLSVLPLYHGHGLISGVLAALAAGSSVVCPPRFDATSFFGWLNEFRPTWYTAVPAIHRAVLAAADLDKRGLRRSSLRLVRSASTTLSPDVLGGLEALFGVPVIDCYGMTEAATQITANPLQRRKPGSVGQQAGAEIAILDRLGRRLPAGRRGEIALRGPTVTRGYDNDAAATASAFRNGWFRTGDLGYLDRDGYLFIVGRIKEIIHKGGQKIAPAEVEAAVLSHPDVIEAAVFAVPHQRLGADIAAAVVLRQHAEVSAQELRGFVRERLAGFKVPGLIQIVPNIPKTAGGKIKRNDLAAAFSEAALTPMQGDGKPVAPRSELERQLAEIWADILDTDQIGVDQDVFALGVDSLAMTQMILRIQERFGIDLSFEDMFGASTVSALALRLQSSTKNSVERLPSSRDPATEAACAKPDCPRPASFVQERMLRIERELTGLPQFNLRFAYRLRGPLDVPALERSLAAVVRRHDALRTGFAWLDEQPAAFTAPADDVRAPLVVEDLAAGMPSDNPRKKALLLRKAELFAEQERLKLIDPSQPPLFRARLLRLSADDHVLVLIVHDVIIDGWSMEVFIEELSAFYAGFKAGRPPQLSEPAFHFSDFARWQRLWAAGDAASRQLDYWKQRLRKAAPAFAANADVAGELAARVALDRFHISNDLIARLSALGHSRGATLFITLLTAFKTLLLFRSGRADICVATTMANRSHAGSERVIGPFANTTLVRTRFDADLSFEETLTRVRSALLEASARQELPFDLVAARLAEDEGLDPASLVQFYFVLQIAFPRPVTLHDVAIRPFGYREGKSVLLPIDRTWFRMSLSKAPSGITGVCRCKSELLDRRTVRHWIGDYTAILTKAARYPRQSIGRLAEG